jgi:hypothetical protein
MVTLCCATDYESPGERNTWRTFRTLPEEVSRSPQHTRSLDPNRLASCLRTRLVHLYFVLPRSSHPLCPFVSNLVRSKSRHQHRSSMRNTPLYTPQMSTRATIQRHFAQLDKLNLNFIAPSSLQVSPPLNPH